MDYTCIRSNSILERVNAHGMAIGQKKGSEQEFDQLWGFRGKVNAIPG